MRFLLTAVVIAICVPFSAAGPGTPSDIFDRVKNNCDYFQDNIRPSDPKLDCNKITQDFRASFTSQGPCVIINSNIYSTFFSNQFNYAFTEEKVLLWSGLYDITRAYSKAEDLVVISQTLPGYMVDDIETWCGDTKGGINTQQCQDWDYCTGLGQEHVTKTFWRRLSTQLAMQAKGHVHIFLNGNKSPSYNSPSILYTDEVPNLRASIVTNVTVVVVRQQNGIHVEDCWSPSVLQLRGILFQKGIPSSCVASDTSLRGLRYYQCNNAEVERMCRYTHLEKNQDEKNQNKTEVIVLRILFGVALVVIAILCVYLYCHTQRKF